MKKGERMRGTREALRELRRGKKGDEFFVNLIDRMERDLDLQKERRRSAKIISYLLVDLEKGGREEEGFEHTVTSENDRSTRFFC